MKRTDDLEKTWIEVTVTDDRHITSLDHLSKDGMLPPVGASSTSPGRKLGNATCLLCFLKQCITIGFSCVIKNIFECHIDSLMDAAIKYRALLLCTKN